MPVELAHPARIPTTIARHPVSSSVGRSMTSHAMRPLDLVHVYRGAMAYVPDERIERPWQGPLWHYLSLSKFLSMLASRALWFSPLAVLAQRDPFEGITPPNVELRARELLAAAGAELGADWALRAKAGDHMVRQYILRTHVAHCWRASKLESSVMWRAYAPEGGVVIRSTLNRITAAVAHADQAIFIGKVRYVDHDVDDRVAVDDYRSPGFLKRRQFAEEREVRLLVDRGNLFQDVNDPARVVYDPGTPGGEAVPVDIRTLVQEVRCAPASPDWYLHALEDVVQRYGVDLHCRKSELDAAPPGLDL